jgi:NAD(P)-dependent dehydrogenase (short-subunit alcohol dehydrogenase family)
VEKTRSLGQLDILVHTAGLSPSMAAPRRALEVNMVGTGLIERAFLPLARPGTAAILIASSAGHTSPFGKDLDAVTRHPTAGDFFDRLMPLIKSGADAYFISKRGVIHYCESVALEWAARGARIATISPGMIATPMNELEFAYQPLMKPMLEMTPIKRFGDPDEIAAAAEFLASADAAFITGADLRIDGGVTPLFQGMAARG